MASKEEKKAAIRERVRRYRERQKQKVTPELVTHRVTEVTDDEIGNLPMSLKAQIIAETNTRRVLKLPDNLRGRQEAMVRRFRGF